MLKKESRMDQKTGVPIFSSVSISIDILQRRRKDTPNYSLGIRRRATDNIGEVVGSTWSVSQRGDPFTQSPLLVTTIKLLNAESDGTNYCDSPFA